MTTVLLAGLEFDGTIRLGDVIFVVGLLLSAGAIYSKLSRGLQDGTKAKEAITNVESRLQSIESLPASIEKMAETVSKVQIELQQMNVINAKLADGKEKMDRLEREVMINREAMHGMREAMQRQQSEIITALVGKLSAQINA